MKTHLDEAFVAMDAAPDCSATRLRFYERLIDAELFIFLKAEPQADQIEPAIFPVDEENYVLAFDLEERLSQFAGDVVPYAGLSGRALIEMVSAHSFGIGFNLEVAPSSILLPGSLVAWLGETLLHKPSQNSAIPTHVEPPNDLTQDFLSALHTKLHAIAGLARSIHIAKVSYASRESANMIAILDARPEAQAALLQAINEVVLFSQTDTSKESTHFDIAFFRSDDPVIPRLSTVGICVEVPEIQETAPKARAAPGSDPDAPPILK